MSNPLTITAELRQWRRYGDDSIIGIVYHDRRQNFFDGEEAIITLNKDLINTPNYYIALYNDYVFRLDKSQEVK